MSEEQTLLISRMRSREIRQPLRYQKCFTINITIQSRCMRVNCKPSNRWSFQLDNLFWELISKPSHGSGEDQLFVYSGLSKLEVWKGRGSLHCIDSHACSFQTPTHHTDRVQLRPLSIEIRSLPARDSTPMHTPACVPHKTIAVVRIMSYSWFPYPSARWEIVVRPAGNRLSIWPFPFYIRNPSPP